MASKAPLKDERVLVQVQITLTGKVRMHPAALKELQAQGGGPVDDSQIDIDWHEAMNLDAEIELT